MKRIVIALGGNALGNTYLEQQKLIKNAAYDLIKIIKDNEIIITHGNGPQVGMITKTFTNETIDMPLDVCTAMSQGYIGFHIAREVKEVMETNNINRDVIAVITEVLVDENDPAFLNPTKPIGKFYTKEEAQVLNKEGLGIYKEDAGRGYRKVVASPMPLMIKNTNSIEVLLKNESVVIACGGGGIPIFNDPESTKVEAVIDKDIASSLLAEKINADLLIILTNVDQVMINYGSYNPIKLGKISIEETKKYIEQKEFKEGSMLPKINAAINFTEKTGKDTIITSLDNINNIFIDKNITRITKI